MKLYSVFIIPIIIVFGLFPAYLNSADIYEEINDASKIITSLNANIINGEGNLNSTFFIIQAGKKITKPFLYSSCQINQKIISESKTTKGNIFIIKAVFNQEKCSDNKIYLKSGEIIYTNTLYEINLVNYSDLLNNFLNFKSEKLKEKIEINNKLIHSLDNEIFVLKKENNLESKLKTINKIYSMNYKEFENNILKQIVNERSNLKYITPVAGKSLPTSKTLIPNASRGYRKDTTDGVHHGYDILAPRGTPVQALGNGVIVRIVRDFSWGNFDKIKKGFISFEDKLQNLDIYRGNQVWLKTMDGNIVFYSHLNYIPEYLNEGQFVKAKTFLGKIDKTGVPDKEYKDYHLHFEIQINPLSGGSNLSNLDIMKWDWFGEYKNKSWILLEQKKMFF
ncbi:M23 family metallopeptidase [Candidatus Gracilibacteria bacterium]|nr:M23 family metallopeptidase [Candidatus Gracilibacteria bacterium]